MTAGMWWTLVLVPAWVLLAVSMVAGGLWHRRKLRRVFSAEALRRVVPASVTARRAVRDIAVLVGIALGIVAIVEPRYPEEIHTVDAEGIDLVIALDLSRSMDCTDVQPSRIERARREILDLLDATDGDRLGLVIYAGGAFARLPLTEDTLAFKKVLEEVDTKVFQAQGSELGEAIRTANEMLDASGDSAAKAILVLSDGEVHNPKAALTAASLSASKDVRVYAMGIGSGPSPIPAGDGTYIQEGGQRVMSTPSAQVLTDVARATGGAYVSSVASAEDVQGLYREMRGRLGSVKHGKTAKRTSETAFQVPLLFGVLAMLFGRWLGEGRRRFGGAAALLLAFGLAFSTAAQAASVADGDAAYRAGRFAEAERIFEDIAVQSPDDAEILGRLGAARYRSGDFRGAADAYSRQSALRGDDGQAEYNAGNADYRGGRLEEALRHYQRAVELAPEDDRAAKNTALVKKEIELRRRMQPPPKEKPQPKDGEEGGEKPPGSSDPKDGAPKDGEAKQGEAGDEAETKPGEPKEGDPKSGEPGDPKDAKKPGQKPGDDPQESQGEPSDASAEAQSQPGIGKPGQGQKNGQVTEDQARTDAAENPTADPSDVQAKSGSSEDPQPGDAGDPSTPAERQAKATLDQVEEGRPRVFVPGDSTGKPW